MKRFLPLFTTILILSLVSSQSIFAQCFELGTTVSSLAPVLKSTGGACPTPAQATTICDCPTGFVAVGYEGFEGNTYGAMVLSQFSLRCKQLNSDGTLGATVMVTCSNGTAAGNTFDGPVDAPAGEAMVGAEIRIGCAIDAVMGESKPVADILMGLPNTTSNPMGMIGGGGGSPQPVMYVPNGNVIVGMEAFEDPGNNISAGVAWRYAAIQSCPVAAPCAEVFFSEYVEGSGNNKGLEIYNPTGATIDLAAGTYSVAAYNNGNGDLNNPNTMVLLTGMVASNDVYVLAHSSAAFAGMADQTTGVGWFNGDDAIVLWKGGVGGTIVDVIGEVGFDPGSEWGTGNTSTANNTIRRKSSIQQGDTNESDPFDPSVEWDGFAQDDFSDLGTYTNSCIMAAVCSVSAISTANISACDDNGTPADPADDTFTVDVTVTFANPPAAGSLDLSGDGTASAAVGLLGAGTHTFIGVTMSADGSAIDVTATFSDDLTCTLNNSNAGTAPSSCSVVVGPCAISSISVANISACDDGGTDDVATDDTFTADITVNFTNAPGSGTLDLLGDASASVAVGSLGAGTHTFSGVSMTADGGAISVTATFSADLTCTLTNFSAGTAPSSCSPLAPDIPTMSEWGLILFALIMFTISVVFGTQYQRAMAMGSTSGQVSTSIRQKFPFDKALYFSTLPLVYLGFVVLFVTVIVLFGYELTSADVPGSLLSGAVIAYLIQFVRKSSNSKL